MTISSLKVAVLGLAATLAAAAANAAEIKVISSVGVKAALEQLKPHFEGATEHKLVITYGTAVPLKRQIDAGETFDVVILTPAMLEDLTKQGKIAPDSKADVAKVGIGVAIRAGAAKPDLGTPESFKQALLDAKSIAYAKEGQSTAILVRIFERLGIAEELKAKTVLETRSGLAAANVVEGKAELAFTLISEILPISGAELAGPLPPALQSHVVFTAGVAPGTKDAPAAKSFIDFFKAPAALPVLKTAGMEPG